MGYRGKFMNQKETICPYAPTYHIHDLLVECGRDACFYEITFPVAAALRSIFCHNVYSQSSITANNMGLNELLAILLCVCVLDSHMHPYPHRTHTHTLHTHHQASCGSCDNVWDEYYVLRVDTRHLQRDTLSSTLLSACTMAMLQR